MCILYDRDGKSIGSLLLEEDVEGDGMDVTVNFTDESYAGLRFPEATTCRVKTVLINRNVKSIKVQKLAFGGRYLLMEIVPLPQESGEWEG